MRDLDQIFSRQRAGGELTRQLLAFAAAGFSRKR